MKHKLRSSELRKLLYIRYASLLFIVLGIAMLGIQINRESRAATPLGQVFAPTSFWYQPIPRNAPIRSDSQVLADHMQRQASENYGGASINTTSYAASVYTATASTPKTNVKFDNCQNKSWIDPVILEQFKSVPIPTEAVPAMGTDREMVIYQPSTNKMWEFWKADKRSDGWYACWGGRMDNVSTSSGIWNNPYGTTATGLPFLGGQISIAEARAGEINHVLGVAVPWSQKWPAFYWPANRTDGYRADSPIAAGQRMRLDPNVNVEALNLPPYGKMIARAVQKYGIVIWDTAGSVSFRAENPTPFIQAGETNPYTALFGGKPQYEILRNFPWSRMQALPLNYGKDSTSTPAPTPTPSPNPAPSPTPAPSTKVAIPFRLNAGGPSYTDPSGQGWKADAYASGGTVANRGTLAIKNTTNPTLYRTERWGMSSYNIPVANGTYSYRLHFAETSGGTCATAGCRVFSVTAEGSPAVSNLDLIASAGANNAVVRTGTITVKDGTATFGFTKSTTVNALINGIELLPATTTPTPVKDTTLPVVSLKATPSSLTAGGTVSMTATATDNVGIAKVDFYSGSTLLVTEKIAPYTYSWNTSGQSIGTKSVTVKAYDTSGNVRTSAVTSVTITAPTTTNLPGDVNGDKRVNALDLSVLISNDGKSYPAADFNKDGTVGAADLAILLSKWTW